MAAATSRNTRRRAASPAGAIRAADIVGRVSEPTDLAKLPKQEAHLGGQSRRHFPERSAVAMPLSVGGVRMIRTVPVEKPQRDDGQYEDSSEALTRTLGTKAKPRTGTGEVRRYATANEVSLEVALTRRRKIDPADKFTQRNGIGLGKPGDKPAAAVEYEPGFFKSAGIVAGSTSGLHKAFPEQTRRTLAASAVLTGTATSIGGTASATSVLPYGAEPPAPDAPLSYECMTLEQRRRAEALVADMEAVETLNPCGDSSDDEQDAQGSRGPSWEEVTGNFTVADVDGDAAAKATATATES